MMEVILRPPENVIVNDLRVIGERIGKTVNKIVENFSKPAIVDEQAVLLHQQNEQLIEGVHSYLAPHHEVLSNAIDLARKPDDFDSILAVEKVIEVTHGLTETMGLKNVEPVEELNLAAAIIDVMEVVSGNKEWVPRLAGNMAKCFGQEVDVTGYLTKLSEQKIDEDTKMSMVDELITQWAMTKAMIGGGSQGRGDYKFGIQKVGSGGGGNKSGPDIDPKVVLMTTASMFAVMGAHELLHALPYWISHMALVGEFNFYGLAASYTPPANSGILENWFGGALPYLVLGLPSMLKSNKIDLKKIFNSGGLFQMLNTTVEQIYGGGFGQAMATATTVTHIFGGIPDLINGAMQGNILMAAAWGIMTAGALGVEFPKIGGGGSKKKDNSRHTLPPKYIRSPPRR
ncbi:MAG: hypothetical protein WC069_00300 [Candidatus Shapirobacteria bacterium]